MRHIEQRGVEAHEPSVRDLGVTLPRGVRAHTFTKEEIHTYIEKLKSEASIIPGPFLTSEKRKKVIEEVKQKFDAHNVAETELYKLGNPVNMLANHETLSENPLLSPGQIRFLNSSTLEDARDFIRIFEDLHETASVLPRDRRGDHPKKSEIIERLKDKVEELTHK